MSTRSKTHLSDEDTLWEINQMGKRTKDGKVNVSWSPVFVNRRDYHTILQNYPGTVKNAKRIRDQGKHVIYKLEFHDTCEDFDAIMGSNGDKKEIGLEVKEVGETSSIEAHPRVTQHSSKRRKTQSFFIEEDESNEDTRGVDFCMAFPETAPETTANCFQNFHKEADTHDFACEIEEQEAAIKCQEAAIKCMAESCQAMHTKKIDETKAAYLRAMKLARESQLFFENELSKLASEKKKILGSR